jgi:opacity protein-like surface antigen
MSARLKIGIVAAAASFIATVSHAADYSPPPCYDAATIAAGRAPPGAVPCYLPPPPVVVEEYSGWYLRGDIGISNQQVKTLNNSAGITPASSSYGFDSAGIFGLGVGYYFNDWLRFDVTGEYRSRANFKGSEIYNFNGGRATDEYTGSKSEWLFLANAYIDLGTWNNVTPFVGGGVGFSRINIQSFQDVCHGCGGNPANNGVSFAADNAKWNFAWALYAGLAYKVSKNFTVELAYRYVDLGKAETGSLVAYDGSEVLAGSTFDRITSHDVKLGLRWNLDGFDMFSRPAPQYYAPPPVYSPPPVYMQPPLQSKG